MKRISKDKRISQLLLIIADAMTELQQLPSGAVGQGGPTLQELDKHVEETGRPWDDDAVYETGQRAWRILESAGSK